MVTIKTLCRRTGYNQSTVNRWIHEGMLPAKKLNTGHGKQGFKYLVNLKTFEEFKTKYKIRKPQPRDSYVRDKSTYKQLIKHENKFKEDSSTPDTPVLPEKEEVIKTTIKKAVEHSERDACIKYLENFILKVYNTYELTPQEYVYMKKTIKILKGEN